MVNPPGLDSRVEDLINDLCQYEAIRRPTAQGIDSLMQLESIDILAICVVGLVMF